MPFDSMGAGPSLGNVAVIGGGISGLGAAYALSQSHRVTLFEAEPRLGGHARTLVAGRREQVPVDTGFIVFNYQNYPLLTGLFDALGVPVKKSDMAFSANIDDGRLEYGLHTTAALFAQRRNLTRPAFWQMLRDITRFNRGARIACENPRLSLRDLLDHLKMGDWFRRYFMLPLASAIWSASPHEMQSFPAQSFVRFFDNHGLLTMHDQPQWYTVDGGSQVYVEKLARAIRAEGGIIRAGTPVQGVLRDSGGALVKTAGQPPEAFDAVVMACHSDQALRLLGDADTSETGALSKLRYTPNRAYLHDDPAHMPGRQACWASWNYRGRSGEEARPVALTYWMNRLQGLPQNIPLFLSLNTEKPIRDEHIFDETVFHHPQFDHAAIAAQERLSAMQGRRNTWFCGAYTRYGFHEDGLLSAVNVAKAMGAQPQWA